MTSSSALRTSPSIRSFPIERYGIFSEAYLFFNRLALFWISSRRRVRRTSERPSHFQQHPSSSRWVVSWRIKIKKAFGISKHSKHLKSVYFCEKSFFFLFPHVFHVSTTTSIRLCCSIDSIHHYFEFDNV